MYFNQSYELCANSAPLSGQGFYGYTKAIFFGVMAIVAIFFNSFALVVLHRWRHEFEDVSRMLFISFAIVNLAGGVSIYVFEGMNVNLFRGYISEMFCRCSPSVTILTMFSSIYHVTLMNLQRYFAIAYPFRYNRIVTTQRIDVMLTFLDLFHLSLSAPLFPIPGFPFDETFESSCSHNQLNPATTGQYVVYGLYGIFYIIPFIILTYINIRLLLIARRASLQRHVVPVLQDLPPVNANLRAPGLKGLRTVLIITVLFYLSFIPQLVFVGSLLWPNTCISQKYDALSFVASAFLICSCWWNVPVYMSTSAKVRQRALDHVLVINLQRYLAVCYPFRYVRLVTVKRLVFLYLAMEAVFFGVSFAFFTGPAFPLTKFMTSWCSHRSTDFIESDGAALGRDAFILFAVFGMLLAIPFVLLTCTNIRLLIIARRASRQQHVVSVHNPLESTDSHSSTPGLKGLRTVLIITGLFYVTAVPVVLIFCAMASVSSLSQWTYDILFFMSDSILVCSCWWNVPVYMSTSSLVRKRAIQLWRKLRCCQRAGIGNRITHTDDLTLQSYSSTGLN